MDVLDEGGKSNESSTSVEEIYLPPQLGSSKWQQNRGKPTIREDQLCMFSSQVVLEILTGNTV